MSGILDLFGGGKDGFEMPKTEAQQAVKTAEPVGEQLSEQAKRMRRRAASLLTKNWSEPKLGYAGLLGG